MSTIAKPDNMPTAPHNAKCHQAFGDLSTCSKSRVVATKATDAKETVTSICQSTQQISLLLSVHEGYTGCDRREGYMLIGVRGICC